jgi:hypothetical protein
MSGFLLKQGSTFLLAATVYGPTGAPVDLTGCHASAQLRDVLGVLVADLSVQAVADRPGVLQFSYAGDTGAWPCGRFLCDLRIVMQDSTQLYSETFFVTVISAITQKAGD